MNSYDNQTYYDVLGLPKYGKKENGEQVSLDSIIKAKDRLKFGSPDDRVPFSMWNKIDEAYSVLSNKNKRKEYDKKLENKVFYNSDSKNFTVTQIEENIDELCTDIVPKLESIGEQVVLVSPQALSTTVKIINELNGRNKYILNKETSGKTISEINDSETELIKEYRIKLEEKIDKLLKKYHFNYDLETDKIRCKNYIELLKKMIELKENQFVKKGKLLQYKLQLIALRRQLENFETSLAKVNEQIKEIDKKTIALKN